MYRSSRRKSNAALLCIHAHMCNSPCDAPDVNAIRVRGSVKYLEYDTSLENIQMRQRVPRATGRRATSEVGFWGFVSFRSRSRAIIDRAADRRYIACSCDLWVTFGRLCSNHHMRVLRMWQHRYELWAAFNILGCKERLQNVEVYFVRICRLADRDYLDFILPITTPS